MCIKKKKKCYCSHQLSTCDFSIVANKSVSLNAEENCCVCVCVCVCHELSKKYKTTHTSWLRSLQAMEPGITGMIQKQNSCYHSMNVLHIILILSDWSITQQLLHKCVMVYMGEVLQNGKWRLVYYDNSHAHTISYVQQFMARKRKRCHSLHLRSCLDLNSCDLLVSKDEIEVQRNHTEICASCT